MELRVAAIAAVVVACSLGPRPAAASWLDRLLNPNEPAGTPAAEAPNKGVDAATADKGAERGRIAGCLPSPAAVRQVEPKAWPRWTRGPNGERCWFPGEKPVVAKTASRRNPVTRTPAQRTTPAREPETNAVRVWDHQNGDPAWQPWVMEYRWDESLRYVDQTRPASSVAAFAQPPTRGREVGGHGAEFAAGSPPSIHLTGQR
jgi:hypothetical protein